jgi:hypothetical protein
MYTTTFASALAGPPIALSVVGGVLYCFAQFGSLDISTDFAFGKTPSYLTCPVRTLLAATAGAVSAARDNEALNTSPSGSDKFNSGISIDDHNGAKSFGVDPVLEKTGGNWSDKFTGLRESPRSTAMQLINARAMGNEIRLAAANSSQREIKLSRRLTGFTSTKRAGSPHKHLRLPVASFAGQPEIR